jgi:hypothetical protein
MADNPLFNIRIDAKWSKVDAQFIKECSNLRQSNCLINSLFLIAPMNELVKEKMLQFKATLSDRCIDNGIIPMLQDNPVA